MVFRKILILWSFMAMGLLFQGCSGGDDKKSASDSSVGPSPHDGGWSEKPDDFISCESGYELQGDTCAPITCETGYELRGDHCIFVSCPSGQDLQEGQCVHRVGVAINNHPSATDTDHSSSTHSEIEDNPSNPSNSSNPSNPPTPSTVVQETPQAPVLGEWVRVPENTGDMGLPAFYVMKYEAKAWKDRRSNTNTLPTSLEIDSDGLVESFTQNKPVSVAQGKPWRHIGIEEAASACESLGARYHLISNQEWMAIAKDITSFNENRFTQGGRLCIPRGNAGFDVRCAYDGSGPEEGLNRNSFALHKLSDGSQIFDMAGNVGEWVDWDMNQSGLQMGPKTCDQTSRTALNEVSCDDLEDEDFKPELSSEDSSLAGFLGRFFGGTGGAGVRGGSWLGQSASGIFALNLSHSTSGWGEEHIGFRCVYRPGEEVSTAGQNPQNDPVILRAYLGEEVNLSFAGANDPNGTQYSISPHSFTGAHLPRYLNLRPTSPHLGNGLSFDQNTGVLSGKLVRAHENTIYTITGQSGDTPVFTKTFQLKVYPTALPGNQRVMVSDDFDSLKAWSNRWEGQPGFHRALPDRWPWQPDYHRTPVDYELGTSMNGQDMGVQGISMWLFHPPELRGTQLHMNVGNIRSARYIWRVFFPKLPPRERNQQVVIYSFLHGDTFAGEGEIDFETGYGKTYQREALGAGPDDLVSYMVLHERERGPSKSHGILIEPDKWYELEIKVTYVKRTNRYRIEFFYNGVKKWAVRAREGFEISRKENRTLRWKAVHGLSNSPWLGENPSTTPKRVFFDWFKKIDIPDS